MRKLILKLTGSAAVRKTVKALRLHLLGNWWLRHFPVVKTLPGTNLRYRARRLESLALSVEMFDQRSLYSISDVPSGIRTFADLGCNVGYFTCWLCHELKNNQLKGLMVDASPEAVEDARWHAEINGFQNIHVVSGLVGAGSKQGAADFFLHTSRVVSTAALPETEADSAGTWTHIKVPYISVGDHWREHFGEEPCDLLKVDIEGSEMEFFRAETRFVRQARAILLEWHKRRVTLDEVTDFLAGLGFSRKAVLHEDAGLGTAVFLQTASAKLKPLA
jgi:FkbM family methyltransferase